MVSDLLKLEFCGVRNINLCRENNRQQGASNVQTIEKLREKGSQPGMEKIYARL